MKPPETTNTSPPTPRFTDEAWRHEASAPKMSAELYTELASLKAKLGSGQGSGVAVDQEAERIYLAACKARKGSQPSDDDDVPF